MDAEWNMVVGGMRIDPLDNLMVEPFIALISPEAEMWNVNI